MTNFDTDKNIFMGASKNWFATAKLSEAEPEQARKVANNAVIRHFEQRLLQKPSTTAKLALPLLRLGNRTKFTMAMCHSQFVAVSRCSILTPAGLQVSSAKPDVSLQETGFWLQKMNF